MRLSIAIPVFAGTLASCGSTADGDLQRQVPEASPARIESSLPTLEYLTTELRAYGYDLVSKPSGLAHVAAPFLIPLPMRYETRILLEGLARSGSLAAAVAIAVRSVVNYLRRVRLYVSLHAKRVTGRVFVAERYGKDRMRGCSVVDSRRTSS